MDRFLSEYERWLVIVLLLILFAQALFSMRTENVAGDEMAHLGAGYSYLRTGDFRLNAAHPPLLKELSALPLMLLPISFDPNLPAWREADEDRFGWHLFYESGADAETLLFLSRLPTLFISLLLGVLLYLWSRSLYGNTMAGLFTLFLYTFSPNILAHSGLFDMDLGLAAFTFFALFQFRRYLKGPSNKNVLLTGFALGLALATKFNALVLLFLLAALWGVSMMDRRRGGGWRWAGQALAISAIALFLMALTYGFRSLPRFLTGFMEQLEHSREGDPAFLMGRYSWTGWWYYFPIAFLIKTPIPTLLFLSLSSVALLRGHNRGRLEEAFLLLPILSFLLPAIVGHINIGLRYILPIYPFLFLFVGRLATNRMRHQSLSTALLGLLCLWYLVASLLTFPHYLAYFNEVVGGPKNGIRWLGNSNIDWGQGLKGLAAYLREEGVEEVILSYFGNADPDYYTIRYQYAPAYGYQGPLWKPHHYLLSRDSSRQLLAVSVNNLQGTFFSEENRDLYWWLYRYEPIHRVGYSIYLYDITGDAEAFVNLGIVYSRYHLYEMAREEFERALAIDPGCEEARTYLNQLPASDMEKPSNLKRQ